MDTRPLPEQRRGAILLLFVGVFMLVSIAIRGLRFWVNYFTLAVGVMLVIGSLVRLRKIHRATRSDR